MTDAEKIEAIRTTLVLYAFSPRVKDVVSIASGYQDLIEDIITIMEAPSE